MGAKISTGWLFTVFFVSAMFLPRIVQDGMFMDGAIYAAIAKHLAQGKGSFWAPYYHTAGDGTSVFYMHPAMKMWLESQFFRIFQGSYWWIERLFCALELLLHIVLIRAIWRQLFKSQPQALALGWLPVLLWYLIPLVSWSMPNNMLESSLNVFCLSAVLAMFYAQDKSAMVWWIFSGICVWAAFLTKGPVGLFPLAAPFLIAAYERGAWLSSWRVLGKFRLWLPALSFLFLFAAFWQYQPCRQFFEQYWALQLRGALDGSSVTTHAGFLGHLYLCEILPLELAAPLVFSGIVLFLSRKKDLKIKLQLNATSILTLLIATTAFLPMLLSIKQRGFYLLPAFPWFAIALAALVWPSLATLQVRRPSWLRPALMGLCGLVLAFSTSQMGMVGRDQAYIAHAKKLKELFPQGGELCICETQVLNYSLEAYLQRYADFNLSKTCDGTGAALYKKGDCDSVSRHSARQFVQGDWILEIFE